LTIFGVYRWQKLDHRLHERPAAERYTPADGSKIDPKDVPVLTALDAEYTRLVRAVIPSVVSITSSNGIQELNPDIQGPFGALLRELQAQQQVRPKVQLGSGVIVSHEGHVLTNRHV